MDEPLQAAFSVPCPSPTFCLAAEGEHCRVGPKAKHPYHAARWALAIVGPCPNCGAKARELCRTAMGTFTIAWHSPRKKVITKADPELQQIKDKIQRLKEGNHRLEQEVRRLEQQARQAGPLV